MTERPNEPMTLHELIRRHQDTTGESYSQIAQRAGLSKSKVGQLANPSYTGRPKKDTVEKIALGLRLNPRIVQRAVFSDVVAAVDGDENEGVRHDRARILVDRLSILDDDTFHVVEVMLDALVAEANGR